MVEKAIYTRLTTDATITAIIGTGDAARCWPVNEAPQNPTDPYLIMQRVGSEPIENLSGGSGLIFAMIQVDAIGYVYLTIKDLADKVRQRLQGFRGTVSSIDIGGIRFLSDRDERIPSPHGREEALVRVSMDFEVQYYV